ncbi:histidine phosphatase family protein [Merdimonas faecis]|uniref:histidine phosphatase family protein n=1 Tax=Merdimonas faecis TaxID=1653435 RepID=UPI001FA6CC97|nr:histidine phosphatase family protein [Merdimonas faecis]
MIRMYLIRHGSTPGNREHQYIGRTEEDLCEEGILALKGQEAPEVQRIYASPMRRCIQTAKILYPGRAPVKIEEFRECDFGSFEGKNYQDLSGDPVYQAWIDSGGTLGFPGGEEPGGFRRRCVEGFDKVLEDCRRDGIETAALIVHGGTIMSIMEAYARPKGSYYDFQVGNGEGYELVITDDGAGTCGICPGSFAGGPGMALSSGAADRASDRKGRKNYQKMSAKDQRR